MTTRALLLFVLGSWFVTTTCAYGARGSVQLPFVTMTLSMEANDLDDPEFFRALYEGLRTATRAHLEVALGDADSVPKCDSLDEVSLRLDLVPIQDPQRQALPTTIMQARFAGEVSFVSMKDTLTVKTQQVYEAVQSAFSGEEYWYLRHTFSADPTLSTIDDVVVAVQSFHEQESSGGDRYSIFWIIVPIVVAGLVLILFSASLYTYVQSNKALDEHEKRENNSQDTDSETGSSGEERDEECIAQQACTVPTRPRRSRTCNRQTPMQPKLGCIPEAESEEQYFSEEEVEEHGDEVTVKLELNGMNTAEFKENQDILSIHSEDDMQPVDSSTRDNIADVSGTAVLAPHPCSKIDTDIAFDSEEEYVTVRKNSASSNSVTTSGLVSVVLDTETEHPPRHLPIDITATETV